MANAEVLGLLYLGLLLVVVKVMEDIFGRLKLPPLLGAVLGGIILGRSVLGLVSDTPYIALFIDLGVILLLFLSGVEEFDITGIRESVSNARIYLIGAVINWIGTAAIVLTVLYFFLDVRGTELLFVSFVLGMSSVAPLSRALKDLGVSKTGTAVRTFVFTLLIEIVGLIASSVALQLSLNQRPFLVLIQMAILLSALYFLRNYIPYAMSYVERFMGSREAVLAILLAIVFILGYFGEIAGFNDAIIALFIGFILSQYVVERPQLLDRLRGLTYGLFEPLFFGGLGLSVSLGFVINEAIPLMALIIALFLTKFTLGYATSILRGARNPLFAAIGSTFKGGVDGALLLAGLTVGVVSSRVYSISIVTILVIVLVCPLLLKLRISSVKDQISTRQGDNLLLPYIKWFSKNVTAEEMSRTLPNVILKGEEPLDRAIREMTDLRILGAVVTNDYGRPIGIVLLNNVVNLDPETRVKLKVEDVMEKEVPLVSSSAPAWEAMEIMKSKDLPLVAVVDEEGRVVGTISERELLLYMTK
jgi:Kef-type K+ transport system membrane component KefB